MNQTLAYLDSRQQEMLSLLERLVDTDSGTHDRDGVNRVGQILAPRLGELGFAVETDRQTEYGDHLVARKAGTGGRSVLFLGHMDTVFPAGTASERPFRMDGRRAYGPGVLDMKGGLVCLLFALAALKATRRPEFDAMAMTAVFNSEEEVLSPTSRRLIEAEAKRADAVCVFEPARPGGECVVARKGVGKYRLEVRGRAAHAGTQPERGRSAILELAHKIVALHGLNDTASGVTVNVGVVLGGERSNVIAEQASAEIDIRVPTLPEAGRLDQQIRAIAETSTVPDVSATLSGGLVFPPMVQTPASGRLFEIWKTAGRELGLELGGMATGGGSDGNYASQYAPTLDGMGPIGSEAHSDREYLEVASLAERAKLTALFLARWAREG